MTSLGSNARTKNFVCETINTLSKPVQDVYVDTLHYTALDPPITGTIPSLQQVLGLGGNRAQNIGIKIGESDTNQLFITEQGLQMTTQTGVNTLTRKEYLFNRHEIKMPLNTHISAPEYRQTPCTEGDVNAPIEFTQAQSESGGTIPEFTRPSDRFKIVITGEDNTPADRKSTSLKFHIQTNLTDPLDKYVVKVFFQIVRNNQTKKNPVVNNYGIAPADVVQNDDKHIIAITINNENPNIGFNEDGLVFLIAVYFEKI